ncbi:hypothetical protein VTL71DRAFT_4930 [Oculimacula yallundae]|uniref:PPPDE domain-containing protein n=1 Tax=Oculimacula yallundae TaxID=86028 RepID=A0ABR4C3C9_9HELO
MPHLGGQRRKQSRDTSELNSPDKPQAIDNDSSSQGEKRAVKFKIGIRFEKLKEDITNQAAHRTDQNWISSRHWALVFTTCEEPAWSFRVELMPRKDDSLEIRSQFREDEIYSHPSGTWTGHIDEVVDIVNKHPMVGTEYSTAFNNCQHWAATTLIFLQALRPHSPYQTPFTIIHLARYKDILKVLNRQNTSLYHDSNLTFHGAHLLAASGTAGALGVAAFAAEATTTVSIPATGLAAFFGAAPSLAVVPAAGAGIAAAAVPLLAVSVSASCMAVGTYLVKDGKWKRKSMFRDPRI